MENKSILEKVDYLLLIAKKGEASSDDLLRILEYTSEHSEDMVLGRVFGWSVSDYAIATLKWVNTEYSVKAFHSVYDPLPIQRKKQIDELVSKELYNQY